MKGGWVGVWLGRVGFFKLGMSSSLSLSLNSKTHPTQPPTLHLTYLSCSEWCLSLIWKYPSLAKVRQDNFNPIAWTKFVLSLKPRFRPTCRAKCGQNFGPNWDWQFWPRSIWNFRENFDQNQTYLIWPSAELGWPSAKLILTNLNWTKSWAFLSLS